MYKSPSLAVDAVVLTEQQVLLVRRKGDPFKKFFALPGGFVEYGETTESAVLRELKEETGIEGRIKGIAGVFSNPKRDPRKHVVSIAYVIEPTTKELEAGDDAESCAWFSTDNLPELAFDHEEIIKRALEAVK